MIENKMNPWLILYLAVFAAFPPFSTDTYLASMPTIQQSFHTTAAAVQLTLALFFVPFAMMQLFWGPLSDRLGRKPVVYTGISVFIIGALLCALSRSIGQLIFARIILAIGSCSGTVMCMAIVRDSFTDAKQMSKALSIIFSVTMIAPMVAPIIGSYLLVKINWQSIFYFLMIYGIAMFLGALLLKESYPKISRNPLPLNKLFRAYLEQLRFPPFLLATLGVSAGFSALFGFIASSPFIYINIYHLPPALFGYFFALNALALIFGTLSLRYLKNHVTDFMIIKIALIISIPASLMALFFILFHPASIWSVVIPSWFVTYGIGILYPELISQALKHVVVYTGLASSLVGTFRFVSAAVIAFLVGTWVKTSAFPLAVTMLVMLTLSGIFMIFYYRNDNPAT